MKIYFLIVLKAETFLRNFKRVVYINAGIYLETLLDQNKQGRFSKQMFAKGSLKVSFVTWLVIYG